MFLSDVCRPSFGGSADKALLVLAALTFLLAPLAQNPLRAQGLDREGAIDAIIGSDVKTEETAKEDQQDRLLAAIENTLPNAERVRKTFNLNELEIIFVPDLGEGGGEIEEAIAENENAIVTLREAIEGSAMFYHAIDSRDILLRDVLAVEFGEESVTIFVSGKQE